MKNFYYTFLAFLLISCSHQPKEVVGPSPLATFKSFWNTGPDRFVMEESRSGPSFHPFFDFEPFADGRESELSVYPVELAGSPYLYDFDLLSGKRYLVNRYCAQKDVWESYSKPITTAPFTKTFVPRVLDLWGEPLTVLVYGNQKEFEQTLKESLPLTYRVRVVGGLIFDRCEQLPCSGSSGWHSNLLLLAVGLNDSKSNDIQDLTSLKKSGLVDWPYLKAYLENYRGQAKTGELNTPVYRLRSELPADQALKFALEKGHLFKSEELTKIQMGCRKLYDFVDSSVKQAKEDSIRRIKQIPEVRALDPNSRVFKGRAETADENMKWKSFASFFKEFHQKYGERFQTCMKMVRPSNINDDIERHWLFAYLSSFFQMEKLGHVYHCPSKTWSKKGNSKSRLSIDADDYYKNCTSSEIEASFEQAVLSMAGFKIVEAPYYRYLQYDSNFGGTHEKLYSWIYVSSYKPFCSEVIDRDKREQDDLDYVFPTDVSWTIKEAQEEDMQLLDKRKKGK